MTLIKNFQKCWWSLVDILHFLLFLHGPGYKTVCLNSCFETKPDLVVLNHACAFNLLATVYNEFITYIIEGDNKRVSKFILALSWYNKKMYVWSLLNKKLTYNFPGKRQRQNKTSMYCTLKSNKYRVDLSDHWMSYRIFNHSGVKC